MTKIYVIYNNDCGVFATPNNHITTLLDGAIIFHTKDDARTGFINLLLSHVHFTNGFKIMELEYKLKEIN